MAGESRTDLLKWVNSLLKLNLTKIEEMGTGAAYCQIFDSIYGDVQLQKVKFDSKQEYEYIANFKVLQDTFEKHKIDKGIPVDRLVKCKMQDNLEFTQWVKKFWDGAHQSDNYDALARRKAKGPAGAAAASSSAAAPAAAPVASKPAAAAAAPKPVAAPAATTAASKRPATTSAVAAPARTSATPTRSTTTTTAAASSRTASAASATAAAAAPSAGNAAALAAAEEKIAVLETNVTELKVAVDNLEKERDFYFNKLREIEILVQTIEDNSSASGTGNPPPTGTLLDDIKKILYSTEEGFEVPKEALEANGTTPAPAAPVAAAEPEQDEY